MWREKLSFLDPDPPQVFSLKENLCHTKHKDRDMCMAPGEMDRATLSCGDQPRAQPSPGPSQPPGAGGSHLATPITSA